VCCLVGTIGQNRKLFADRGGLLRIFELDFLIVSTSTKVDRVSASG